MASESAPLSSWANAIAPSPTLAVDAKAKALKAAGEDVCGFGAGEPDFDTPEFIKEACVEALRKGETKYAPAAGIPPLREALSAKFARANGIPGVEAEDVVVSPGGKYSCFLAIQAVVSPGEEVVVPAPYWVSYPEMVKLAGGRAAHVFAGQEDGFKISPEALRRAITPKTRMVVLNSPSNPTGAVYAPGEVEALMEVALEAGIYVLSDEIYEYLVYDDAKPVSPASLSRDAARSVITVSGFSKTFSMTGWRLGALAAPRPVARAVASLQSQTTSNATTFAQWGALAALRQPEAAREAIDRMREVFDRRRLRLLEGLRAIDGVECERAQGAFYLFPRIAALGLDSSAFAERLLDEQKTAVVPGAGFGADAYVRLSYAVADDVIERGLDRIARFCEAL